MRDEVQTGEQPKRRRWAEAVGQPAGSVEAYRTSPTRRAPASTKGNCPDLEVRDQRRNPRRDWTTATRLMIDAGRRSAGQSKSAAANDSFLSMRCLVGRDTARVDDEPPEATRPLAQTPRRRRRPRGVDRTARRQRGPAQRRPARKAARHVRGSQLRAEIVVSESRPRLYHVRQEQGRVRGRRPW